MFFICVTCIFILISKNIMILVESNVIDFFLDQAFCVVSKNTLSSLRLFLFSFLPEYCSYNLCLYMMFFLGLLFVHGKKKKRQSIFIISYLFPELCLKREIALVSCSKLVSHKNKCSFLDSQFVLIAYSQSLPCCLVCRNSLRFNF